MDFDPRDLYGSDSSDIWQHRMLQYECTKFKMTDTNWLVINGYIFFGVLLLASIATWLTSKKEKQDRLMTLVFFSLLFIIRLSASYWPSEPYPRHESRTQLSKMASLPSYEPQ